MKMSYTTYLIRNHKICDKKGLKMAEEKETKGSNLIQIRVSDKMKDDLQKKADELGLPLTTYVVFLIAQDLKKP